MYMNTHMHTHMHTHTCTRTCTHTHAHTHSAECAQILIRNVKYEVPALRQQISKCHSTQRVSHVMSCDTLITIRSHDFDGCRVLQDCERKEGECLASVTTLRNKFQVSCKEMNISVSWDGEEGG